MPPCSAAAHVLGAVSRDDLTVKFLPPRPELGHSVKRGGAEVQLVPCLQLDARYLNFWRF
jgi:hypothetical protein